MIRGLKRTASRLKHQLVLEQEAFTTDDLGGFTREWEEVATLWSEIVPIGGKEYAYASQLTTSSRFRITLRYRGDITPRMRLRDDATGRIYNIRSVINIEEKKQLMEILAEQVRPAS